MWILLAGALGALQPARRLALLLLAFAVGLGFYHHVLTWPVLPLLAGTGVLAALRRWHPAPSRRHLVSEALLVLISLGLLLHLFPGFNNPLQVDNVKAGAQSLPFSFSFNADKALIPFVLLACLPTLFRARACPPRYPWIAALALIAAVPLLLVSAVLLGGLAVEPHFPPWLGAFMLANLFFVSLAEEALFRGYLQQRLREALGGMPALLLSALLFGLAHAPGGMLLVVFATLAGLLYGLAWHWSGRLWLATALHFALNLTHLLFFTYPALQH
ncbi:CPBP family intramembrane glutamic endopeptidase [Pantoea sp. GD03673]|uniref:CPBP family intramembrane glutamic endopeptidase n=1 Tax=Pantoea sp. GD03673 TaxID=2975364 RepID=UPI0024495462|nr:CPBP family intramembrane glutamic endopeptidase [Pantoea sp. GD03673]MDH2069051.1 CPBP family intramembrane metalloprotease [Pantoea sp. GD03673]